MRAKPYGTGNAQWAHSTATNRKGLLLVTRKRVRVFFECQLIVDDIFLQLILDLLGDLLIILSRRIHIVPSAPKTSIPILVLQVRVTLKDD